MNVVVWVVAVVVAALYVLVAVCLVGRLVITVRRARERAARYRRVRRGVVRRPSSRDGGGR